MTEKIKNTLKDQILESMRAKDTKELLEILGKNDHDEWTEEALEAAKVLLRERLGDAFPPAAAAASSKAAQELEEEPYHDENKLLKISIWARTWSWVVLVLYLVIFLSRISLEVYSLFISKTNIFLSDQPINVPQIIAAYGGMLTTPALGVMYFLLLQAISEGIFLLIGLHESGLQMLAAMKNKQN